MAKTGKSKKKSNNKNENYLSKPMRDSSGVKYYNYLKKGHYLNNCSKFTKN